MSWQIKHRWLFSVNGLVQCEFQTNSKSLHNISMSHVLQTLFIYLKFKFNWASFISFGNLIHSRCTSHVEIRTVKIYCFSLTFSTQTKNCQISTSTEHYAKPYSTPQVLWIPFILFFALFCHSVSIQLDFIHFCIFIY